MGTWGVHYTIPFGYAFEIFQSERLKKQKKQKNPENPTKYIGRMFEVEILKVVQIVELKISKTINHRLENMVNNRGV